MGFELKKPFKEYVAVDMLPKTRDATNFVVSFPYQIKGTMQTERKQLSVAYSDTQAATDANNGVKDGLAQRKERAIATLERGIAQELRKSGERIYDVPGRKMAIWAKKK